MAVDEERLQHEMGEVWDLREPPECPTCGYNVTGLPEPRCPECGGRFTWKEIRQHVIGKQAGAGERGATIGDYAGPYALLAVGGVLWGAAHLGHPCWGLPLRALAFVLGLVAALVSFRAMRTVSLFMPEGFEPGPRPHPVPFVIGVAGGIALCIVAAAW